MKGVFYFVVLLGFCSGEENRVSYSDVDNERGYVDNPDNYEEIIRPCQVYDLNCIRRFFAKHSKCSIKKGPVPGVHTLKQFSDYISRINFTLTNPVTRLLGLNNSVVEEFYINKATNKVILAIEARDVELISNLSYFSFYRRGREKITQQTTAYLKYISVTLTAVMPYIDNIQLDEAEITAYNSVTSPFFYLGPEVASDPDPAIVQTVVELLQDVPTNEQELLFTEARLFFLVYFQTNICDFGLKSP